MAAICMAAACSRVQEESTPIEEETPEVPGMNKPITFSATIGIESKTTIDDDLKVSWAAGDIITVFDADGNSESFTVEEACASYSFTSTGVLGDGPYYAITGYGECSPSFDKGAGSLSIDRSASVSDGSFGQAWMSVSKTSGTSFKFKHVYGALKLSLASDAIKTVKFTATGIAPSATTITFGEDGTPAFDYGTALDEITIMTNGAGTYYIPAIPGTYSGGFAIFLYYGTKTMKAASAKSFTLAFNRLLNFGTLDGGTPTLVEVNAFLDESQWGCYSYERATDTVTELYQYAEGTDQYALPGSGNKAFRLQNLNSGQLAGITLSASSVSQGDSVDASVMLYGISGQEEGTSSKILEVLKVEDGKAWLLDVSGNCGFIIPIE